MNFRTATSLQVVLKYFQLSQHFETASAYFTMELLQVLLCEFVPSIPHYGLVILCIELARRLMAMANARIQVDGAYLGHDIDTYVAQ